MEEPVTKKKLKIRKWVPITLIVIIFSIISLSLFLIFKPSKEYSVSFKVNGGTNLNPLTINKNAKITKPEDPTREGYDFAGWYYKGEPYDFNEKVTENLTLEAKWTKKEEDNPENPNAENIPITGISLNTKAVTLAPYETTQLKASIEPLNATNKEVEWESSNEKVAIADVTGKVKALKEGTTTITVKTKDGEFEASCTITVVKVKITGITIKGPSSLPVGNTIKLIVDVSPKTATLDKVTWTSSNSSIATIDANGNIKGLKTGSVTITATSSSGCKATYKITVTAPSTTKPETSSPSTSGSTSSSSNPEPSPEPESPNTTPTPTEPTPTDPSDSETEKDNSDSTDENTGDSDSDDSSEEENDSKPEDGSETSSNPSSNTE